MTIVFIGDPGGFPGQMSFIDPPASSGFAPRSPHLDEKWKKTTTVDAAPIHRSFSCSRYLNSFAWDSNSLPTWRELPQLLLEDPEVFRYDIESLYLFYDGSDRQTL